MLDATTFGYLGGLTGAGKAAELFGSGQLTGDMASGYERGSGIRTRLNEADYGALSDYNLAVKRAGYLGEDFEYNADYDDLSTNLMYHKDYVPDSDELKSAKQSLRSAGFADIPLFEPSSWAQAGVQFIRPNQFNAKNLPYSVSGAGAANVGAREENIYDKLRDLYNEWGQYESSGFEGGNKMGGNKSNWGALKSFASGDRPEFSNAINSEYGSNEALKRYLETGEITSDLNPTYALQAYDYAVRETARQQQTKSQGFFSSLLKGNIGAIVGGTLGFLAGGPAGAAIGAGAGATAQGIEAGDSFLSIAVSAAGSYFAAGSIANGWTNAFGEMTLEQAQAAGLTGASGVGAAGTGGTLAASQAAGAYAASNFVGPLQAGILPPAFGTTNTVVNVGKSAQAYANAAKTIASGGSLSGISQTVLSGLANNAKFFDSLNAGQQAALVSAATTTGSKVVDAAIKVLDTTGKYTGTVNAGGLATTAAATADAVTKTIEAKEQEEEAEVRAEEFGESFETVYEDAYSDDVASESTVGGLGSAMPASSRYGRRFTRRFA
jgi:hypothetical protein